MVIAIIELLPVLWLPPITGRVTRNRGPAANWTLSETKAGDAPFPNSTEASPVFYFAFPQVDPMLETEHPYR